MNCVGCGALNAPENWRKRARSHRHRRGVQVILADDVVAVEHTARLVPHDLHDRQLVDALAEHIPSGRVPEVMEQPPGEMRRLTGGLPRPVEVLNRLAFAPGEHPGDRPAGALFQGYGLLPQPAEHGQHLGCQRNRPRLLVLRGADFQPDATGLEIHPVPCEPEDFPPAPAIRIGEVAGSMQEGK